LTAVTEDFSVAKGIARLGLELANPFVANHEPGSSGPHGESKRPGIRAIRVFRLTIG
jgi:hypothetical protein